MKRKILKEWLKYRNKWIIARSEIVSIKDLAKICDLHEATIRYILKRAQRIANHKKYIGGDERTDD